MIFWISSLFFLVIQLAGADELTSAPSQPPQIELGGKSSAQESFGIEVMKLRDPFRRMKAKSIPSTPKPDLEMYPVDAFKLIGITTGPKQIRALLLGPNGKTYLISESVKIGLHGGQVRKITALGVQVREKIVNILGQEENLEMEIVLPSDQRLPVSVNSVLGSAGAQGQGAQGQDVQGVPGSQGFGIGDR